MIGKRDLTCPRCGICSDVLFCASKTLETCQRLQIGDERVRMGITGILGETHKVTELDDDFCHNLFLLCSQVLTSARRCCLDERQSQCKRWYGMERRNVV